jgi:hypothetical protein
MDDINDITRAAGDPSQSKPALSTNVKYSTPFGVLSPEAITALASPPRNAVEVDTAMPSAFAKGTEAATLDPNSLNPVVSFVKRYQKPLMIGGAVLLGVWILRKL